MAHARSQGPERPWSWELRAAWWGQWGCRLRVEAAGRRVSPESASEERVRECGDWSCGVQVLVTVRGCGVVGAVGGLTPCNVCDVELGPRERVRWRF